MRSSLRTVILLASGVLVAACGPSVESVIEAHRAAAEAKVELVKAAAADAEQRPPVARPQVDSAPKGPLVLSNETDQFDTGVVLLPMVLDPCKEAIMLGEGGPNDAAAIRLDHAGFPSGPDEWFRDPACLLAHGKPAPGRRLKKPEAYEQRFARLEGLRYLAIVRYHRYDEPQVLGDAVSATKFGSGRIDGDILLYDATDGRFLAATPLEVRSSRETSTNPSGAIHSAADAVLTDFRRRTDEVVADTVQSLAQ